MAATIVNCFPTSLTVSTGQVRRRRRITPQAAHALTKLGHAIEHLSDEFVNADYSCSTNSDVLEAVRILMALNRQVYFECTELPTWSERFRAALGLA
jgi:hypothetical protein